MAYDNALLQRDFVKEAKQYATVSRWSGGLGTWGVGVVGEWHEHLAPGSLATWGTMH